MTEAELISQFIRIRTTAARMMIEIQDVSQDDDTERLSTRWALAAVLPVGTPKLRVDRMVMHLLADYRWFGKCDQCSGHQPKGWLTHRNGEDFCRECEAERK